MKRSSLACMFAAAVGVSACVDDPSGLLQTRRQLAAVAQIDNTYLVRFKNSIPANFAATVTALGGEVIYSHAGAGVAAVAGLIPSAADRIAASPGIAAVDADAYTILDDNIAGVESVAASVTSPTTPTTAWRFARQWHLQVIEAPVAWGAGYRGASTVKVGVLDTGVDYLAPDLVGRVDLSLSKSFLSAAENARVQVAFPGAHEVADLHYHGTHTASTVASNAYITAGVTSQVMLVSLKVCAPGTSPEFNAYCPMSSTLSAILYAADHGIPIINMSLGGGFHRQLANARGGNGSSFLATINNVMNYANRKGTVVVVSAGNDAIDMDNDGGLFITYCDAVHVVCASATGPTAATLASTGFYINIQNIDALAYYSNFGGKVTVAAPGGNAVPVWEPCSGFSLVLTVCQNRFFNSPTSFSGYILGLIGTSMAAPHATGVLALIESHLGGNAAQLRDRIATTADDLGPLGWDPAYGYGRINARRALGL